jgi:hypothetical protein
MRIMNIKQLISVTGMIFSLALCGGGGGGSTSSAGTISGTPTADDSTPDAFTFTAHNDSALASLIESTIVTISGINVASSISIANGEYRINSGGDRANAGTVVARNTVTVRVMSPSEFDQSTAAIPK